MILHKEIKEWNPREQNYPNWKTYVVRKSELNNKEGF